MSKVRVTSQNFELNVPTIWGLTWIVVQSQNTSWICNKRYWCSLVLHLLSILLHNYHSFVYSTMWFRLYLFHHVHFIGLLWPNECNFISLDFQVIQDKGTDNYLFWHKVMGFRDFLITAKVVRSLTDVCTPFSFINVTLSRVSSCRSTSNQCTAILKIFIVVPHFINQ